MREIQFRGKTESGEWVYGYLNSDGSNFIIRVHDNTLPFASKFVLPETVGQYTGIKDIEGVKIFEGDIVKWNGRISKVFFHEGAYYTVNLNHKGHDTPRRTGWINQSAKVIGNVHDNPGLLKGE